MKLLLFCGLLALTGVYSNPIFPKNFGKSLSSKIYIDPARKYLLGWELQTNSSITFEVEVETKGYVGFGISPSGSMQEADLFIAGVKDGSAYSGDYHSAQNGPPIEDSHPDWELLSSEENATHTILRFSRLLDTCDPQDYPIGEDTNRLIWSVGSTDDISYHATRGTYSVNLLLPDDPFDGSSYIAHNTIVNNVMPSQDTAYWCTIHKGPEITKKHHIVAFEPYLPTAESVEFTHHFVLSRCTAPEGTDPDVLFGSLVGDPGNHCYIHGEGQHLPTQHCQDIAFVWAKGGKRMVFPEDVGYPIGEDPSQPQYYMLEIHYDNPNELENIQFETGLRQYITPNLRPQEASLLTVGAGVNPSLLIPPQSENFVVAGHCPEVCSKVFLPKEGVTIFNILLHGHLSGRKLKLRQFRNKTEIPWLEFDDHYDFNYQQNKPIKPKKLMPGDQLTYECTYASTWKEDGGAVTGGLSSRDEMCESFIWYYPRTNLELCRSFYPFEQGLKDLGFTKWSEVEGENGMIDQWQIDEPEELKGNYLDSVSFKVKWEDEFKKEFQEMRRFGRQDFQCGSISDPEELFIMGKTQYVEVAEEYKPAPRCQA